MSSQLERASHVLFPDEGGQVMNVKFFRGYNRRVTAEQLADQINRADAQIRAGEARPMSNIDGD